MQAQLLTLMVRIVSLSAPLVLSACAGTKNPAATGRPPDSGGDPVDEASVPTAGRGAYRHGERLTFPEASGPCMDAELADLDGDGDVDVVLAMEVADNAILWNNGDATFTVETLDTPAPAPGYAGEDSEDVALFDVDGDGRLDLLFVTEDLGGTNELWLQADDGWSRASERLPTAGVTNGVAVGDLDGDGALEVVLANAGDEAAWSLDGAGGFVDRTGDVWTEGTGASSQDPELADLDGDGDLDLVVANESGDTALFFNDGGVLTPGAFPTSVQEETREVDAGDLDGDGDLDLVLANVGWGSGPSQDRWLENDGTGSFSSRELPPDPYETLDVDLVDLDHDGDLDILRANVDVVAGRLVAAPFDAFLNDGAGTFSPAPEALLPWVDGEGLDVEVGDLDGDGWADLYLCASSSRDTVLLWTP